MQGLNYISGRRFGHFDCSLLGLINGDNELILSNLSNTWNRFCEDDRGRCVCEEEDKQAQ